MHWCSENLHLPKRTQTSPEKEIFCQSQNGQHRESLSQPRFSAFATQPRFVIKMLCYFHQERAGHQFGVDYQGKSMFIYGDVSSSQHKTTLKKILLNEPQFSNERKASPLSSQYFSDLMAFRVNQPRRGMPFPPTSQSLYDTIWRCENRHETLPTSLESCHRGQGVASGRL